MRYQLNVATILTACLTLVMLYSCGNKKDDEPEKTNYLEAKINGAIWNPSTVKCVLLIDGTLNFRIVNFTSTSGGKTVTVEANDDASGNSINTGSRTLAAGNAGFVYGNGSHPYHPISGTLNISDADGSSKTVSGSFDFIVEDDDGNQVHISDGKFVKVSYTVKTQ